MFLAGFCLWNMDNIFCHHLTTSKQQILLPWSAVLEGHGWWHILTGLGKLVLIVLFVGIDDADVEAGSMWNA
jgi:dihydroceramidase